MATHPTSNKFNLSIVMLPVLLLAAGCIYMLGLPGVFQLDDFHNLAPTLIDTFTLDRLIQVLSTNGSGIFGRPISILTFTLSSVAHGDGPWGYKYHNILIHLSCGLLVFLLVRKLVLLFTSRSSEYAATFALLICAIWLLHPLQVSTVLYAVQRMTQLSALFTLGALLCAVYTYAAANGPGKWLGYFLLFPLLMLLGLLSKENAVLLPVFLMLLVVCQRCATPGTASVTPVLADKLFFAFFIVLPLALGCALLYWKFASITDYTSRDHTMAERLLSQIQFVFLYIKQLLLPKLSQMGLFFDDVSLPQRFDTILSIKAGALLGMLAAALIALRRGAVLFAFGILFYFAGHLLESTFVALEPAFEHRNYLPSLGIFISLGSAVSWLISKQRLIAIVVPIWYVLLLTLLVLRLNYWSDGRNWQLTTLAYHPYSERTWISYIYDLRKSGLTDEAIAAIDHATQILPERLSFRALKILATCVSSKPEDNQEHIDAIYKMVSTRPLTVIGYNNLAALVNQVVNRPCQSISNSQVYIYVNAAINYYESRDLIVPMLGYLHTLLAKMHVFSGDPIAAETHYRRAFSIAGDPQSMIYAAKALLSTAETRKQGIELLAEINENRFFFAPVFSHDLKALEDKIANENYVFSF